MSPSGAADSPVSVLIVDDHQIIHWGLTTVLSRLSWVERCFGARTAAEAVAIAVEHQPEVAVIDLRVGDESGLEICQRLHLVRPGLRALLISGARQIAPTAAVASGAAGFVVKDAPAQEIVHAIRAVALGRTSFTEMPGEGSDGARLSQREREVLALVGTGATNNEIARRLHLSSHTVKDYVSAIYRKLGVRNRAEAVRRASSLGLGA